MNRGLSFSKIFLGGNKDIYITTGGGAVVVYVRLHVCAGKDRFVNLSLMKK